MSHIFGLDTSAILMDDSGHVGVWTGISRAGVEAD
jgi:hypothetical protein